MSIDEAVREKLLEGECPTFDGIIFGTGAIVLLECSVLSGETGLSVRVRPLARSTLESLLESNPQSWTSLTSMMSYRDEEAQLLLSAGEAAWGSEGFVEVRDLQTNALKWLAIFQSSNPFKEVRLAGDSVVAVSTYDHVWTFPLNRPELVTVSCARSVEA